MKTPWFTKRHSKSKQMSECLQELFSHVAGSDIGLPLSQAYFSQVLEQVRRSLDADVVVLLDVSRFRPAQAQVSAAPEAMPEQNDWRTPDGGDCVLLGRANTLKSACFDIDYNDHPIFHALATFIRATPSLPTYNGPPTGSLCLLLPPNSAGCMAVPVHLRGNPNLLILTSSSKARQTYKKERLAFVSSVSVPLQTQLDNWRLKEADDAKLKFIANVTHEVRTPLYGILSQIELLRQLLDPKELKEAAPLIETAEACGASLKDLLDNVLDFDRLQYRDGCISLSDASTVDLGQFVAGAVDLAYTKFGRLSSVMVNGLPLPKVATYVQEPWSDWTATLDAALLCRVLLNLVTNSLKYTKSGSICITVERVRSPDALERDRLTWVQFGVKDTGIGIKATFQQQLFTPFAQEDNFSPGVGLGLSVVQNLVQALGGRVMIWSQPDTGTEVKVQAPLRVKATQVEWGRVKLFKFAQDAGQADHIDPRVRPSLSNPPSYSSAPKVPIRVLVVDDNSIARRVLTTLLSRKGIVYQEAANGLEALEIFKGFQPHLVFTDISMPVLDGVESAKRMRQHEEQTKATIPARIVALSGLPMSMRRDDLSCLNGWVVKGGHVGLQELAQLVDRTQQELQ